MTNTIQTDTSAARHRRMWLTPSGTVCLRDEDAEGEECVRDFWVPPSGGYVRETEGAGHGTLGRQVCTGLASLGYALESTREGLLGLIRWEYRRRQRVRARENETWR